MYLAGRCATWALRPAAERTGTPLFELLTAHWSAERRQRLLVLIGGALALVIAMVGLSSSNVVDVGYAVMEGATDIVHGVLPYGHVPGVFHGDTYPIGSYLLYAPVAALSPVATTFDNVDATLLVAVVAALAATWALLRALGPGGLRSVVAWLAFPPLLLTVSTGTTDVLLALIIVGAVLLWRRPTASTGLLAAGAWFKLFPVVLLPLWLARLRGWALTRALAATAAISATMVALLLALGGPHALTAMVHALGYQDSRVDPRSLWGQIGSVPLQQLAQAATVALIAGSAVRVRRDPVLAGDRARIAGLSAAILLGVQISAGYWVSLYLVWTFPLLALSLFAPTPDPPMSALRTELCGGRSSSPVRLDPLVFTAQFATWQAVGSALI